ncbi:TPA: FtsW/RodA/SpoVE family cell cycle protein [Streptococcus suis]|uniref:cell division peptidoglycan polymerase FtsW n=1 Tax=Streptococcus suis TaxID=1307 RepID=UPI000CF57C27|nr:FtsW/RodA/SpoVE family cell cycle protein [Streptococcus suis]MDW8681770.1 FtsW/RodA/SpoVE family cell cycle protein [Streptococcus suis]NQN54678.1 FtsW/RodA/SpoVE family cell cycle protein [Streptococcus suis]NRG98958.1 FtsW/RodA/SpoVE family cell cycle protein [Streptococcus suis]HEM5985308.1 FtsW/RodA/SpoVE family cell cycle protein [Streptococcus suis]HEM5989550.1 FtsW/RodA/SpoVE family cell cycle protein [Streptococcus suis]
MKIDKRQLLNYSILIPYFILSVIGLVMVYSTTSANQIINGGNPFRTVINQAGFWGVSLLAIYIIYRMKLSFLRKKTVIYSVILVEVFLLAISRLFPPVNGAHGWIPLPVAGTLQPAEYLKLIIIWYLAHEFAKQQAEIRTYDYKALIKGSWIPREFTDWRVISILLLGLVATLPDLGNATIITLIMVVMISVSGIAYRWFSTAVLGIFAVSTLILGTIRILGVEAVAKIPLFGYIARRFSAYFDPFGNATGSGLQLTHSYYAMSNGGWFGRGLGNSIEKKGYLPEAHTDFAFSIVIEELGFVGASLILGLLFFLIIRIIIVGVRARSPFNSMMALGIAGMLLIQTFVNIGGIAGIIPATGVTFPFVSQGGSSLLIISISIAFVLNIDANEKRRSIEEIEQTLS